MSISVHHAAALPAESPWARYALPNGFPFLVIDEQSKIIEPTLLYLLETQLRQRRRKQDFHTADALAYDLKDWFDYLSYVSWFNPVTHQLENGKPWDVAGEADYIAWRNALEEVVSPHTKRPLASSTIARRQGTVERFYAYASKQGWYTGDFVRTKIKKGRVSGSSHQLGNRPRVDADSEDGTNSAYRAIAELGEPVRALTAKEWHRLQLALGPLPSQRGDDSRPSRNRLACELSIGTGLRVDEVANLTEFQLRGLHQAWLLANEEEREQGFFALRVVKTKRLKARDVLVPGYLIPELMLYLDEERESSIKAGLERAKKKSLKFKRPSSLFVNEAQPTQHAGKAVSATSLSWAFNQACLHADITHPIEKIDIETNERFHEIVARHSFHDLRHSFAVWTYHSLKNNGNPEPWKEIQVLLGHESLAVTLDTYLKVVEVDKRNAGKAQYAAKQKLGDVHA